MTSNLSATSGTQCREATRAHSSLRADRHSPPNQSRRSRPLQRSKVSPKPYTLNPIPYTLYPIPSPPNQSRRSRSFQRSKVSPKPYTLYPIPYILYPLLRINPEDQDHFKEARCRQNLWLKSSILRHQTSQILTPSSLQC